MAALGALRVRAQDEEGDVVLDAVVELGEQVVEELLGVNARDGSNLQRLTRSPLNETHVDWAVRLPR